MKQFLENIVIWKYIYNENVKVIISFKLNNYNKNKKTIIFKSDISILEGFPKAELV